MLFRAVLFLLFSASCEFIHHVLHFLFALPRYPFPTPAIFDNKSMHSDLHSRLLQTHAAALDVITTPTSSNLVSLLTL